MHETSMVRRMSDLKKIGDMEEIVIHKTSKKSFILKEDIYSITKMAVLNIKRFIQHVKIELYNKK